MDILWIACTLADAEKIKNANQNFYNINPSGKVFKCKKSEQDEYMIFYKNNEYRISQIKFREITAPIFDIGDEVYLSNSEEKGIILEIYWHFKNNEPFYILEVNGKSKSKRYFEKDFIKK